MSVFVSNLYFEYVKILPISPTKITIFSTLISMRIMYVLFKWMCKRVTISELLTNQPNRAK